MAAQHPPRAARRSFHAGHTKGSGSVPGQNRRPEAFHRGGVQLNCVSVFQGFQKQKQICFLPVFLFSCAQADKAGKDSDGKTVSVDCV